MKHVESMFNSITQFVDQQGYMADGKLSLQVDPATGKKALIAMPGFMQCEGEGGEGCQSFMQAEIILSV